MNIADWFKGIWSTSDKTLIDIIVGAGGKELYVKALEIGHAIDLISKTISKSEIKVYRYNKNKKRVIETIDDAYYRLNIRPNYNEQGTAFFYRVIQKLLIDQEALILLNKSNMKGSKTLYLAKSFDTTNDVMLPKKFNNIILSDTKGNELKIEKTYDIEDVIYLTLGESKIKEYLDNFYNEYAKLLSIASKSYKLSNLQKWKLKYQGTQNALLDPITKQPIDYEAFKKKISDGLIDEDKDSIIMLADQFDLIRLNKETEKTSEDYRKMVKDVGDQVAKAFNIPLDVYYGSKTDKSTGTNDFITFAVSPILEILEDGMNAKLFDQDEYIKGEKIKINKFNMKHFDIMDVAGSLEKLKGISFSHNDIEGFLGIPLTDEEWAKEHYVTKNFGNVKGGEKNNGR
jgi:HK97 family phage portal protein